MKIEFEDMNIPADIKKHLEEAMRKSMEDMDIKSDGKLEFYEADKEKIDELRNRLKNQSQPLEINTDEYEQYRSDSFQEILSNEPSYIVRHGVAFMFGLVFILILCTAFVRYPEIVTTVGKLYGGGIPTTIIAESPGKLVEIYVKDGQEIMAGQKVGLIQNISASNQVIELDGIVNELYEKIKSNQSFSIPTQRFYQFNDLGELQEAYQQFLSGIVQNNYYQNANALGNNRNLMQEETKSLQSQITHLLNQIKLAKQDLELTNDAYDRMKKLDEKGYVSKNELLAEESKVISKKSAITQMQSSIANIEMNLAQRKKGMLDIGTKYNSEEKSFAQAVLTLKANIEKWKKKYVLTAPISGKITFNTLLSKNRDVKQGDAIFSIITPGDSLFVLTILPHANFGKIKLNQKVNIKFQAYPHYEYGVVAGVLTFINSQPSDSGYVAKILLPNGMNTLSKNKLEFKEGLLTQNEIITEDMSLLKRMYIKLVKKVGRN